MRNGWLYVGRGGEGVTADLTLGTVARYTQAEETLRTPHHSQGIRLLSYWTWYYLIGSVSHLLDGYRGYRKWSLVCLSAENQCTESRVFNKWGCLVRWVPTSLESRWSCWARDDDPCWGLGFRGEAQEAGVDILQGASGRHLSATLAGRERTEATRPAI